MKSNVVLTATRLSSRDALSATVEQPTQAIVTPVTELEKNDQQKKNHIPKKKNPTSDGLSKSPRAIIFVQFAQPWC